MLLESERKTREFLNITSETPDVIEADEIIKLKTDLILGFGKCNVMITFDWDNDGEADTEATGEGIILGPLIFTPVIPIPPPSP